MLTCRELTDFLDDYLSGNLPRTSRFAFKLHLSLCRTCRTYLKTYRATIDLARASLEMDAPVPGEVPEQLVQAIILARAHSSDSSSHPE